MDMLMEYPLAPFVEYEVKPLADMDAGFDRFIGFIERVSAQMAG